MTKTKPAVVQPQQTEAEGPCELQLEEETPRDALRRSIATHATANAKLEATRKTISAAEDAILKAVNTVELARVAAAKSPGDNVRFQIDLAATGGPHRTTPVSVREARAACEEAEANLQALRDYRVELQNEEQSLKSGLSLALTDLQKKVADVIRAHPGTLALINRFKAMQIELMSSSATLQLLGSTGGTATGAIPLESRNWSAIPNIRVEPDQAWARAIDKLLGDADFPLPEG
jgi:hypothetical protein